MQNKFKVETDIVTLLLKQFDIILPNIVEESLCECTNDAEFFEKLAVIFARIQNFISEDDEPETKNEEGINEDEVIANLANELIKGEELILSNELAEKVSDYLWNNVENYRMTTVCQKNDECRLKVEKIN